jgi:cytochrome c2
MRRARSEPQARALRAGRRSRAIIALLLALGAGRAFAGTDKDAFDNQCASCHTLGDASTASGPTLKGVIWRKVAGRGDFAYSAALRETIGTWTPDRLDSFLKDTQAFAPGTDMYWEIQDASLRRQIIDFLKTAK